MLYKGAYTMATDFPILEKVKDSAGYVLVALGALYLLKLVLGLEFSLGFAF